jgi:hypothetical protein
MLYLHFNILRLKIINNKKTTRENTVINNFH